MLVVLYNSRRCTTCKSTENPLVESVFLDVVGHNETSNEAISSSANNSNYVVDNEIAVGAAREVGAPTNESSSSCTSSVVVSSDGTNVAEHPFPY
jgi:hypothetical protein